MIHRTVWITMIAAGVVLASLCRGATPRPHVDLAATLPELRFDETPLAEVYDFVRDVAGINLHVNWRALEEVGVTRDTTVNLNLRNITVRKLLDLLIADIGAADRLTWYVDDGVVEVTMRDVADQRTIVRVYPIDDLIMEIPDFVGPNLNLSSLNTGGGQNGGGSSVSLLQENDSREDRDQPRTKAQRVQALIDLITQTIQPDIWRINGGTATIAYLNGSLVINAPRSIHEAIGGPVD